MEAHLPQGKAMDKGSLMTIQISKLEGSSVEPQGGTRFKDLYVDGIEEYQAVMSRRGMGGSETRIFLEKSVLCCR